MTETSQTPYGGGASKTARRPRIGITMGDPAGIGPEVVLKAVAEREVLESCAPVIIGDAPLCPDPPVSRTNEDIRRT